MNALRFPALAFMALVFSVTAQAQLKAPRDAKPAASGRAAAAEPQVAAPVPAADIRQDAEKETAGVLAAAGWLTLLDRRDWGRAWETAAGMFRSTVPLAAWMDGIPKVREPLGSLIERGSGDSIYKTSLAGRPDGDYVSVSFNSKFDKQQVQEIVTTVREADGKWRITGYSTR